MSRRGWTKNPALKSDAMRDFDNKLMDGIEGTDRAISQTQEILSGRVFDTLIGSPIGKDRRWKVFDLVANSCHRWVPWGTLKTYFSEANVWNS
eukprot:10533260-Heterocapsa_arctica.AAC.1